MKKLICTALASLMLLSAVSCGKTVSDTAVTSTTSAAEQILIDRLGEIPENVVLGDALIAAEYGIDMTDFEDDGYVIRTVADETFIFGKTDDGLDRAVRKYALATQRGEDISNITYHEGYRIEEFKIFGTDISEYVIVYGTEPNANMEFAATELVQLVKKACGADLTISETASDAAHKIILRHSKDEELREDGFRYFEENGNLVIEGAVARGCMHGVYRFLQNECGWENLDNIDSIRQTIGDSYLNETDLVDIPEDINVTQIPSLDYIEVHTNQWEPNYGKTDRTIPENAQISYGTIVKACHGMQSRMWDEKYHTVHHSQACYTDEGELEMILDNICIYIDSLIEAGEVPGETIKMIDISQGDNNRYCSCVSCSNVMSKYKTVSSTVVYGANYIAEEINEMYPSEEGIAIQIFAYFATKIPPSSDMEVNEHVYITFAQNGNCSNHSMYGTECTPYEGAVGGLEDYLTTGENINHDEWLRAWCDLSDNVYVWNYALDWCLQQYTVLDVLYDDFKYMHEIGVKGLFWQNTYHGFGIKRVEHVMGMELMWDIDMTEEEYEEKLCRLLQREYGEGWAFVREYLDLWYMATNERGCGDCWGMSNRYQYYSTNFVREHGDIMIDLIEKAVSLAGSADEEYRIKLLSCHVYYEYLCSSYFWAYEAEDTEKLAEYEEMYLDTIELIKELDFDISSIKGVDGSKHKVYPTLEQEAWLVWVGEREKILIYPDPETLRPAPAVEDIYAETDIVA